MLAKPMWRKKKCDKEMGEKVENITKGGKKK